MKKFIEDFRKFVSKGNVFDMAVGVVVGGAFGKITTSLVNDIIMPLIGKLVGGIDVTAWKWVLTPESVDAEGNVIAEVAVRYGNLIQTILDFLIIALSIFIVIRIIASVRAKAEALAKKNKEEAPAEPAPEPEP